MDLQKCQQNPENRTQCYYFRGNKINNNLGSKVTLHIKHMHKIILFFKRVEYRMGKMVRLYSRGGLLLWLFLPSYESELRSQNVLQLSLIKCIQKNSMWSYEKYYYNIIISPLEQGLLFNLNHPVKETRMTNTRYRWVRI